MFDDLIPQQAAPAGGGGMSPLADAISKVESGGNYRAIGPAIPKTGDRALGKYQVMGANVGPWTEEILGRRMTPQEYLADDKAQDAVFQAKFGSYVQKYGPEGAAKAWFAGEKGMNNPNARDVLGTTVSGYAQKFNSALGPQMAGGVPTPQQAPQPQQRQPVAQPASLAFDDLIPDPMAVAREKLAAGLSEGKTNEGDIYKAAAFKSNIGVPKASATDLIARGATAGWDDEITAAVTAPIDMAMRGEGYDEARQHNLAAIRDRVDQYAKENPGKAIAAELAGGLSTGSPTAAASLIGRVGQGMGIGGVYGSASGAGNAEEGARIPGAVQGGALGAGIGGGIPVVGAAVRAVTQPVTRAVSGAINPEARAMDALRRDMARDGIAPAQARTQLEEAASAGKPMTMLDVGGRNVMGLGRAVATSKGAGSEKMAAMIEARKLDAPARVMDDVKAAFGDPETFHSTIEQIVARRKAISAPLYEAAYAKAAPETPLIKSILSTPAGQAAIRKAQQLSANEGIAFGPDVRGLDLIKRSFDDMIETAKRGGQNNEARIFTGMKDRLIKEVDRAVPEYKAARQAWSSEFELQEAVERGRAFLKPGIDPEVAVAEIKAMSAAEKEVARIGLAREIKDRFERSPQTLSQVNQILNSNRIKPVLAEIFPSAEALSKFRGALMNEARMLQRGQQVVGGSPTANKLSDLEDTGFGGAAVEALQGRPISAALNATANIGRRLAKGVNEKTANKLGDIFTTTDPAKQRALLDQIEAMLPPGAIERLLTVTGAKAGPQLQSK